ncbi:MAG TPA: hypothetical protein VJ124_25290 [Pyrinomonadaceae bacterium]|nr:hypothetical protein [Pyrinomonadaceae bacterium]
MTSPRFGAAPARTDRFRISEERWFFGVLMFLFLALNGAFAIMFAEESSDSREYLALAKNISSGHGYSMTVDGEPAPSAWRVPLYPAVLASLIKLFGSHNGWIQALQVLANGATLSIAKLLCRRLNVPALLVVPGLALVAVPLVAASAVVGAESLNALLVCLAFALCLLWRPLGSAGGGALLGISALLRPENQVVGLVVCLALFCYRQRLAALVVALAFCGTLLPWALRNHHHFGFWAITDPVYSFSNLPLGTSGDYGDPIVSMRVQIMADGITQREREQYVSLAFDTYVGRWRGAPLSVGREKAYQLAGLLTYALEGFVGSEWGIQNAIQSGKYHYVLVRVACKVLYGPVFFCLAVVGLFFGQPKRDLRFCALHMLSMVVLGFLVYAEPRFLLPGRVLLLPAVIAGALFIARRRDAVATKPIAHGE